MGRDPKYVTETSSIHQFSLSAYPVPGVGAQCARSGEVHLSLPEQHRETTVHSYGPFKNLTCSLAAEHVNSSWHGIILCIGIQFEILALIWSYCGLWEEAVAARKNSHKVNMQTIHREGIQPAGGFEPMTLLTVLTVIILYCPSCHPLQYKAILHLLFKIYVQSLFALSI